MESRSEPRVTNGSSQQGKDRVFCSVPSSLSSKDQTCSSTTDNIGEGLLLVVLFFLADIVLK